MDPRDGSIRCRPEAPPDLDRCSRSRRRHGNVDRDKGDLRRPPLTNRGSTPDKPELGRETSNESEALIEAFKSGQPFYALTVCKASTEVNGGGSPVIVRQAVPRS